MSRRTWYCRLALRLAVGAALVYLGVSMIARFHLHGTINLAVAGAMAAVVGLGLRGSWSYSEYQRKGRP